jgi:ABC-2 type transport system permease protein
VSIASASIAVFGRASREGRADPGPAFVLPTLPPLLLVVAMTSLFDDLAAVLDVGGRSFAEHFVPAALIISAIAGAGSTSAQVAHDFRSGLIDRLRLGSPNLLPLLTGRFAFEAVRILPGFAIVLGAGLAAGGAADNGAAGVAVAATLAMLLSMALAGVFHTVAILTRDPQTPLNLNPLGIIFAFLSSAFVPRADLPGWADAVASVNPITAFADASRAAMIGDLTSGRVAWGLTVGAVLATGSLALAHTTLARTLRKDHS